ncbi:MAG: glutamine--fructose-6-phosphate transaminase (isomerizing) [Candidatus Midichloria mitochondrii]|nr:glutamine--fructose-6-phosphate transaminase (isomerizing) [Candidatus Midichloria mitochondrii]
MCGIIGVISSDQVVGRILKSLKLLEYRGYDSAGVATIKGNNIKVRKKLGKLANLAKSTEEEQLEGNIGLGHTRWATHGTPKIENTHPIVTKDSAVVHNGIIENYRELKEDLIRAGYKFHGDTDTEVIPNIIDFFQNNGATLIEAVLLCANKLKGAFAIGLLSKSNPDLIIAIKQGSPLIIGLDEEKKSCYLSSDASSISEFCREVIYLEDGQIGILESNQYKIIDFDGQEVAIKKEKVSNEKCPDLSGFSSFMLKEIYEQPKIIKDIIAKYDEQANKIDFSKINHIKIIACGTSMYAGYIAKLWLEEKYNINTSVEIASEFSTKKNPIINKGELFFFISQSGETADTLASLKLVKKHGGCAIGIINNANSTMAKLVDKLILVEAGIEIAVAATKTFLAQLATFAFISGIEVENLKQSVKLIQQILKKDKEIYKIAKDGLVNAQKVIFIGRAVSYPIALEGALKMKELAYIPAEGIAAGELKHGSIALIDEKTSVIVIAPEDSSFSKIVSNINEIKARSGKIILIACRKALDQLKHLYDYAIEVPEYISEVTIPFIYTPVLQFIAHHTALLRGNDVDKPRNLAKSVTVE